MDTALPFRTMTAIVSSSWVEASMSSPVWRTKLARAVTSVSATTIPKRTQASPSPPSPIFQSKVNKSPSGIETVMKYTKLHCQSVCIFKCQQGSIWFSSSYLLENKSKTTFLIGPQRDKLVFKPIFNSYRNRNISRGFDLLEQNIFSLRIKPSS